MSLKRFAIAAAVFLAAALAVLMLVPGGKDSAPESQLSGDHVQGS